MSPIKSCARLVSTLALGLAFSAGVAFADAKCELAIEGSDAMQYNTKELTVPADCQDITLNLKHAGKLPKSAMGHNWVLTNAKDKDAVIAAGATAGLAKEYVPEKDAKVVAATKLVGGGESTSVSFKRADLKAGESYTFFCTFPGHAGLMTGTLKF